MKYNRSHRSARTGITDVSFHNWITGKYCLQRRSEQLPALRFLTFLKHRTLRQFSSAAPSFNHFNLQFNRYFALVRAFARISFFEKADLRANSLFRGIPQLSIPRLKAVGQPSPQCDQGYRPGCMRFSPLSADNEFKAQYVGVHNESAGIESKKVIGRASHPLPSLHTGRFAETKRERGRRIALPQRDGYEGDGGEQGSIYSLFSTDKPDAIHSTLLYSHSKNFSIAEGGCPPEKGFLNRIRHGMRMSIAPFVKNDCFIQKRVESLTHMNVTASHETGSILRHNTSGYQSPFVFHPGMAMRDLPGGGAVSHVSQDYRSRTDGLHLQSRNDLHSRHDDISMNRGLDRGAENGKTHPLHQQDIEKAVKQHLDIGRISEQVYHNIERRIRMERERRGM